MGEYTLFTIVAVLGVLAIEFFWLRTGILRTAQYWLSMALVFFFQIWVDGWPTKLSDPDLSSTTPTSSAASGFRSTYRSKTSASVSRWSPSPC
ncbi:MAG: hypothetical protein R2742_06120 [Micropruina glycogenica]